MIDENPPAPAVRPIPFPAWLGWGALAAAMALAIIAFTLRLGQARLVTRANLSEDTARLARAELRATQNQLAAERILAAAQISRLRSPRETAGHLSELRIATLSAPASQPASAQGAAVWDPVAQQGLLTVAKLPALAADRDYQLWLVDPQYPQPVDAGVFAVDAATGEARLVFKAAKSIRDLTAFTISVERKGGSPTAEGPPVLTGK